ncbi:hypothetical protein [Frankia sp. CcWB3]
MMLSITYLLLHYVPLMCAVWSTRRRYALTAFARRFGPCSA